MKDRTQRLLDLKTESERNKEAKHKMQGRLESIAESLKNKFEVSDKKSAIASRNTQYGELEKLKARFDELLASAEEKYNEKG